MTNAQIIDNEKQMLATNGIIGFTGRVFTIKTDDGEKIEIRETEEIHTHKRWHDLGFQVRKGEKAIAKFKIWKYSTKQDEETGEDENSVFMKTAAFFSASQVDPIETDPESSPEEGSEGAGERKPNAQQIAFDFSFEDAAGDFFEEAAPREEEPLTTEEKTAGVKFYPINEEAARRAKEANSWNDYKAGSATAEYKKMVRQAAELAQNQKNRVDPMYHDRIDSLLDTYARRLAENLNKQNEIDARVPSVLIAGGSNFPTRKKEKQNAARDRNYEEYKKVESLLDKIRGAGMGGISSDDPQAIEKLRKKLSQLENLQATMRSANAYFRKNKTLEGCPVLTDEQIKNYYDSLNNKWNLSDKPFESYELSNNNANIRRIRQRIKELERKAETTYDGWEFSGGYVEPNTELNRLQIFFDGKPEEATREELKRNGFRWSPKNKAWQRQLNANAYRVAKYIDAIKEN